MKKRFMEIDGDMIEILPFPGDILNALLDKLREGQSFCPFCGGEMVCDNECVLRGLWHKEEE